MYRYVIIDDEYLTRAGLLKKVEPLNHLITCVGEAVNGKEGISLIEKLKPDFIITDMYMPVMDGNELLQYVSVHYPNTQIIVISGYRNFEYAQNAIHSNAITYLLKPFSSEDNQSAIQTAIKRISEQQDQLELHQISETIDRMSYEFDIQTLRNLILGTTMARVDFNSKAIQDLLDQQVYSLLTIVDGSTVSSDKFLSTCMDFFDQNSAFHVAVFDYYFSSRFVFILVPSKSHQSARNDVTLIAHRLTEYLCSAGHAPSVGVCTSRDKITELHQSFLDCVTTLDNKPLSASVGIFFYDGNRSLSRRDILWNDEHKFRFYVDMGLEERVSKLLDQLFSNLKASKTPYTLMDLKYYFLHLLNAINIGQNGVTITIPTSADISDSYRQHVKYIFDIDTLIQRTRETMRMICQRNQANPIYSTDKTSDAIVQNMQQYIKHNYNYNISLESVADLFFLNKNYASTLFKAKSGVKFIDYLTHIRVEKAKELLSNSTLKIPQIAVNVGYSNTKYFYRVFKKLTGYTPEEYRTLP